MLAQNARVDHLSSLLTGSGDIKHAVQRHESRVNFVITTSRWGHATYILHVHNIPEFQIASSLVQLVAVDQELKQRVWLLSAVLVNAGHVKVVYEQDHLLAVGFGTVGFQGTFVYVFFNDVLEVLRCRSRAEVDIQEREFLLV